MIKHNGNYKYCPESSTKCKLNLNFPNDSNEMIQGLVKFNSFSLKMNPLLLFIKCIIFEYQN